MSYESSVTTTVQEDAEANQRRLRLLGDVSNLLSMNMKHGLSVDELARLVVPTLADWCTVTLVQTGRVGETLGWAHHDADIEPTLGEYARVQAASMNDSAAIAVCLRTGDEVFVPEIPPLADWVENADSRALLEVLAPKSVLVLPLQAAGRTLGAIALVRTTPGIERPEADLLTAREVAKRAGLALDNARLYGEQHQLSETLQRSLLTEVPEFERLEVATRYVTASAEARVGGDWYDAFVQRDGTPILIVGDVVGHDSRAAAAMGQLRGLCRGIAFATGDSPMDLLTDLDEAIVGLGMNTTATAIVASVEGQRDEDDGRVLLRWSNAGHPPPMIVGADGTVTTLESTHADLLLGVTANAQRTEHLTQFEAGSSVLFYTDGLIERRGMPLTEGLSALRAALGELRSSDPETMCNGLLDRFVTSDNEDDVVVMAARLRA